ncbi:hypothetical protein EI94DRAFT_1692001 [Lactarius quietus]|nr:hypothetical protein EI94DRAFT_1692001 [Lactarius quietus]
MGGDHRQQLARLSIPAPFQVHQQVPLYSPGMQTAIHRGFPPPFPPPSVLQTPIQPSFFPAPSLGPPHPQHHGHRAAQASIALAAAGIHPPHGPPLTPLGHGQFPPAPFGGPQFPPFRNRRQPSVSIGGPPKAQLGGAGKNYRPPSPTVNTPAPAPKPNKATVNLPKETLPAGDGRSTRSSFARNPIPTHLAPPQPHVPPPDVTSADIHPPDSLRVEIPNTIDVFLPGRSAWDAVKKKFIDEKLEKLGVEKGTGSSMLPIHAPHARAASISSPADPALLFFKLNKLQQAQNSHSHSASVSPQPIFSNSPPPPTIIQPLPSAAAPLRHGHSLSMVAPPFIPLRPYTTFNKSFGTSLGMDAHRSPDARSDPGLPTDQSLAPPAMPARADSRPDFVRGFGLDAPDEAEEEQEETEPDEQAVTEEHDEEPILAEVSHIAVTGADDTIDMELEEEDGEVGEITTAAQSRVHSRHVSRLSAALSLRSVGGRVEYPEPEADHDGHAEREIDPEDDAISEWTGSEDLRTPTEFTEDEESIGEWSNPSDEERARQQRQERRLMRRAHHQRQDSIPRRIPNFPHPPPNPQPLTSLLSQPREIDEDMISNPSDDNLDRSRTLPLPSSRPASSRLSIHDPIRVHSRAPSSNFVPTPFQLSTSLPIQAPVPKRTTEPVLNPNAKPFVFGGPSRLSGSFSPGTFGPQPQQQQPPPAPHVSQLPSAFGHSRGASLGKPLNAGAPEFRPNTFTFTLPPNVPKFPQPQPPSTPPPQPSQPPQPHATAVDAEPARAQQGREKRQRRSSVGSIAASDGSGDGRVVMTSFKFPQESPARKSAPPSPAQRPGALNATARPFTLPDLSGIGIGAMKGAALSPDSDEEVDDGDIDDDGEGDFEGNVDDEHELPMPLAMKARRAPIPLDFKHPVSTNTVPAGLFKALANGNGSSNGNSNNPSISGDVEEQRTRRAVRSRLGSREIFEHASRPSLDDLHVPAISRKASRGRLITDPGRWDSPAPQPEPPQVVVRDRRASLPVMSSTRSSFSDISVHPQDISRRLELQQYEERLEALLESKLDDFREEVRALRLETGTNGGVSSASEAAINGVVSLFRAQLQESAARGLDDSQMDARGELDFQIVKDIVEQGHAEARSIIQQDLDRILARVEAMQSAEGTPINGGGNTEAMLEEYHARTRNTVVDVITPISERLDALERFRPRTPLPPPQATPVDHEALVRDLRAGLVSHIAATRAEPIDYDVLTEQLSQAVKPHISQLIDLASDKRETAGLIVDRLIPVLPKIFPAAAGNNNDIDVPAVVAQITAEIRRIVAPLDPHEMKEQVSGLVVERLHSRLATRDRVLDALQNKLAQFDNVLEPVKEVASRVAELSKGQEALSSQTRDLADASHTATDLLSTMPDLLTGATEPLRTMLSDLISTTTTTKDGLASSSSSPDEFRSNIESLSSGQQALHDKTSELVALHQDVLARLKDLPDNMAASIEAAQLAHAELLAHTVTKEDFEEVRSMMATNSDLQVQLAKARAQYGAARAEKDIMLEHIASAEAERDRLREKVDEIQAVMLLRATDAATSQARTTELEEALAQSLARLKTSDVTIESQQERLLELEKLNRELNADKQALVSKVHSLETQVGFATRDKDAAVEALAALRKENDALMLQQSHWDDLRRTNEQLEQLATLVSQAQTTEPELKELRRVRDRSKVLESEHSALQRRYKDQETRMASSDRAASTARASLAQAQQRASEWEQRANENEVVLEEAQVAREQAEDRAAQMEVEHALVRMQLDEKDAEERLAKDRENKLRDQVAALEARVAQLLAAPRRPVPASASTSPARPDSRTSIRTSTVYPSRATTPTAVNGRRADTPPQTSVYDSIHAPMNRKATTGTATPRRSAFALPASRYEASWTSASLSASRVASPTPSVVSVAPTLGDDGWYE